MFQLSHPLRLGFGLCCVGLLAAACSVPESASQGVATAAPVVAAAGKGRVDIEGGIVRLAARRDGVISKVAVEEGDRVKAGQVLAELEAELPRRQLLLSRAELQAAVAERRRAQIEKDAAGREQRRLNSLAGNESVSGLERDQAADRAEQASAALLAADAAIAAQRARVAIAEREIEERRIVAPLDGQIVQRQARPGNGVSTLNVTPLFLFVPDGPRIVRVEVEEHYLPAIRVDQRVEIVLDADNNRRWSGRVLRIGKVVGQRTASEDPTERQDNRVVEVVATLDGADALIGQRVVARFMGE